MAATGELEERSLYEHQQVAKPLLDPVIAVATRQGWVNPDHPDMRALRDAEPDVLRSAVIALHARAGGGTGVRARIAGMFSSQQLQLPYYVLQSLGSKRPPFTRRDVALLLGMAASAVHRTSAGESYWLGSLLTHPVAAAERAVRQGGLGELEGPIRELAKALGTHRQLAEIERRRVRLLALVEAPPAAGRPVTLPRETFSREDTWGVHWAERAASLASPQAQAILHCGLVSGVSPTKAWSRTASALITAEGVPALLREMLDGLTSSTPTRAATRYHWEGREYEVFAPPVTGSNAGIARGALWMAALLPDSWVDGALGDIGIHFGTSGTGSNETREERLANAAAAALGTRGTMASVAALGRLKAKVTNRNVSKQILKALDAAAAASSMSASELLELAVSDEGLDANATREIAVGDHVAVLALDGDDVSLTWRAPGGRVTARPPVALDDHKAEVTKAKEAVKELRRSLAIERGRVEDLLVEDREWALADWRARYLEHPLTGSIGRRLIWRLLEGDGGGGETERTILPDGDVLRDASGDAVEPGPGARIRAWHPATATDETIGAWRSRLMAMQLRQPFKQAFREVYLLTPAEEETERYSNRFAAHVLRYPQARALMTARRWASNFLGPFDGGFDGIAKREFRSHAIRAEFWHDAVETEAVDLGFELCRTDQVRFYRIGEGVEPMPLADVPPMVFSEAMRDVDLFVSVTTIGADRNWQDRGLDGRFGHYLEGYDELPLTASAAVRRDALERMLPGLAIADRLTLEERALIVRGDLRTYRIHLGSGNIYMAPSDQYLCIVPARGGLSNQVFLPFDDDPTLSIILSKAFLLAADRKITDRSITSQIGRG